MMKIRLLLAAVAVFATAFTSTSAFAQKKAPKKDIAVQMFSLRDDIGRDYKGTVEAIGEMGFTAVEAAGYGDGKFYGRTPLEFKADLEAAGLRPLSSHAGRGLSPEEYASKDFTEAMKWWDQAIVAHKSAGIDYIVIPYIPMPGNLKDLKTLCDYFNEIGKRMKENDMKLGYHNHHFEFHEIEGKKAYDFMLENTDPESVFFEMDVYWAVMAQQSPVDYFKKYPGRFKLLHIKDRRELGQSGMVGFDAIFNNADIGGLVYPVVEVEAYSFAPYESVRQSLEYLQKSPFVKKTYDNKK